MSRKPKLNKKDVNVNTLFPSELLQQLDEWAWRNRMTRSAALRAIVESAFSSGQKKTASLKTTQQPQDAALLLEEARAIQEKTDMLYRDLQQALQEVEFRNREVEQIKHTTTRHAQSIEALKIQLGRLASKADA